MTSRRKSLAALLAVVAVALAAPVATASATPSTPAVGGTIGLSPNAFFCGLLVGQLKFATATGQTALVTALGQVLPYACPSPAI